MENKISEVRIPKVEYEGTDKKLLERIKKFKTGTVRIIVFTIVGMVMGWLSFRYTSDTFIVTKIIMAVPYKISEVIYVHLIGTGTQNLSPVWGIETEFFTQSVLATFFAERLTPVLTGGALYGSLAYFTGDKRVFTLERFLRFAGIWAAVILLFIAGVYGINAKAISDNENRKNISTFFLTSENRGETFWEEDNINNMLTEALEEEIKPLKNVQRLETEVEMDIYFADGLRKMVTVVNYKENYMMTENGNFYYVSDTFCGYIREYWEKGFLRADTGINSTEGETGE